MPYINIEIKKLENSEIEISGEILAETLESKKEKALKNISQDAEIKGFRKGHVPEEVLLKNIGEMTILQEAAELALSDEYPAILIEHKINPLGNPQISLTKLAPKENLGFKIKTAVMPEVTLSDYKTTAKKIVNEKEDDLEVTNEEVEKTIEQIKQQHLAHSKDKKELEINDDFVKTLGDFKDVADFKAKIKENTKIEKKRIAREKKRNAVIEEIIEKSKIEMPQILVDGELERMLGQFKADVERAGLTYENYLKEVKKTEEDIKKEWTPVAIKKAKMQLILNQIALAEKISPESDQVEKEVEHLMKEHKDAPVERIKIFVETMLTNEKVFEFLEAQK